MSDCSRLSCRANAGGICKIQDKPKESERQRTHILTSLMPQRFPICLIRPSWKMLSFEHEAAMGKHLTLREALASGRLGDFVRQAEARGVELASGSDFERALALLITQRRSDPTDREHDHHPARFSGSRPLVSSPPGRLGPGR